MFAFRRPIFSSFKHYIRHFCSFDYNLVSCRLRSDLQESLATIKRLKNVDVVNESGESPDVVATSSIPSLGSHDSTSTASTQKPDIFIMPDDVSEGSGLSVLYPDTSILLQCCFEPINNMNFSFLCGCLLTNCIERSIAHELSRISW